MSKKQILQYWQTNLKATGVRSDIQDSYLQYITPLIENDIPIIFDFEHLCKLLGRNGKYMASVVNSNYHHYRQFRIPKRNEGFREITTPYLALLECQYWIYENILKKVKIHPTAQGFAFKKSIITNSTIHVNQQEFLRIDLKDFFSSIKINRIIAVFQSLGYTNKVSFYLASICCINDELPQGAPTSPYLSNIVCKPLDTRLLAFAKRFDLKYTRYADDLAFSGDNIPPNFITYITEIIEDFGLQVNTTKTLLQKGKGKRILTGISIASNEIKIPRQYKRRLKQEIYFIQKYGLTSHIRKKKIRHPYYLQSLIGKVHFWLSVEPSSVSAKKSLVFLKELEAILHYQSTII